MRDDQRQRRGRHALDSVRIGDICRLPRSEFLTKFVGETGNRRVVEGIRNRERLVSADHFDVEGNLSYRNYGDYTDGNGVVVTSAFKTFDYSAKVGFNPVDNHRLRFTWRQSFGRDIKHAGLPMDSPYDDSYLLGLD